MPRSPLVRHIVPAFRAASASVITHPWVTAAGGLTPRRALVRQLLPAAARSSATIELRLL
jgi:hypothetical protein